MGHVHIHKVRIVNDATSTTSAEPVGVKSEATNLNYKKALLSHLKADAVQDSITNIQPKRKV